MSGGSYDYLYIKDECELLNCEDILQEMVDRLAGLGYAGDAAAETEEVLLTVRQMKNRIRVMRNRLSGVWHAVEWWDSRDSTEDTVKEALIGYRCKA